MYLNHLMRIIITKLKTKKDDMIKWHTQAGNITTNMKVKVYLPHLNSS